MKEKICNLRLIRWIQNWKITKKLLEYPFFQKLLTYEIITYIICGVLTTIVNYVSYFVFRAMDLSVLVSNILAWVTAVIFAFWVNKVFVFLSTSWSLQTLYKELIPFLTARALSLAFDTGFMVVAVDVCHFHEGISKLASNVFVMIMNYFASKLIFKPKKDSTGGKA